MQYKRHNNRPNTLNNNNDTKKKKKNTQVRYGHVTKVALQNKLTQINEN